MKKGDEIICLSESDCDPVASANSRLVAALVTLGIPLYGKHPFEEHREKVPDGCGGTYTRRSTHWMLRPKSRCGQYDTRKMIEAWHDPDWPGRNPEHPFAYLILLWGNYGRLIDHVKGKAPLAVMRDGKRMVKIPFDAPSERREDLLARFERRKPVVSG